jgi:hypothetical protein
MVRLAEVPESEVCIALSNEQLPGKNAMPEAPISRKSALPKQNGALSESSE